MYIYIKLRIKRNKRNKSLQNVLLKENNPLLGGLSCIVDCFPVMMWCGVIYSFHNKQHQNYRLRIALPVIISYISIISLVETCPFKLLWTWACAMRWRYSCCTSRRWRRWSSAPPCPASARSGDARASASPTDPLWDTASCRRRSSSASKTLTEAL